MESRVYVPYASLTWRVDVVVHEAYHVAIRRFRSHFSPIAYALTAQEIGPISIDPPVIVYVVQEKDGRIT